jgi:hypothetical protein
MTTPTREVLKQARDALFRLKSAGAALPADINALARLDAHLSEPDALQAAAQPVAEHFDELKATLEGAHSVMEAVSALERRVGPVGSHARGYTHKITKALRHLEALRNAFAATPPAGERSPEVPKGWKLLKDSTHEERSWREDAGHENGNYSNACCECGRMFLGHKRRVICKVCSTHGAGERSTPAEPTSWVEAEEKNTPLWQACVRAAKVNLATLRYMSEQKRHQQFGAGGFGYHAKTEECGFAAAIYKEIVATPPSPQPKEGEQP